MRCPPLWTISNTGRCAVQGGGVAAMRRSAAPRGGHGRLRGAAVHPGARPAPPHRKQMLADEMVPYRAAELAAVNCVTAAIFRWTKYAIAVRRASPWSKRA